MVLPHWVALRAIQRRQKTGKDAAATTDRANQLEQRAVLFKPEDNIPLMDFETPAARIQSMARKMLV